LISDNLGIKNFNLKRACCSMWENGESTNVVIPFVNNEGKWVWWQVNINFNDIGLKQELKKLDIFKDELKNKNVNDIKPDEFCSFRDSNTDWYKTYKKWTKTEQGLECDSFYKEKYCPLTYKLRYDYLKSKKPEEIDKLFSTTPTIIDKFKLLSYDSNIAWDVNNNVFSDCNCVNNYSRKITWYFNNAPD